MERSSGKKVLQLVGDASETLETYVPFQTLQAVGVEVHAVCPGKKSGDSIHTAVHELEEGWQTYTEKRGHMFKLNASFDEAADRIKDYDGLLVIGGRAPEYLRTKPEVLDLVRKFADTNKPLAAICHGPQILAAAGVLKGKSLTSYPGLKPEIEQAGGKFQKVDPTDVVTDGNLITSPIYLGHPKWMRAFIKALGINISSK
jgi:protease I